RRSFSSGSHDLNLVLMFTVSCSILVTPILMFVLAIIFLASIGKSLGVRRLYVKLLLKIFEFIRVEERKDLKVKVRVQRDGKAVEIPVSYKVFMSVHGMLLIDRRAAVLKT
ncbi:hypothetical protein L9F63_004762, partial [Diploptera punctata]